MNRLFKANSKRNGYNKIVDSQNSGLKYIEMGRLCLDQGCTVFTDSTGERELCMNIMAGSANLKVDTEKTGSYEFLQIGERQDVFSGYPTFVYIPINSAYTIEAISMPFAAVLYSAPCSVDYRPRVVTPKEVIASKTGALNWSRIVIKGIAENVDAQRLIAGETLVLSGNWTSFPPHKHDKKMPPFEQPAEEVYSFHFNKPEGFAFIRLYTDYNDEGAFDESYAVEDGDVIVIPRGYHTIAVAPGYKCRYLFCLAAEDERQYGKWSDDPRYGWIKDCETVLERYEGYEQNF